LRTNDLLRSYTDPDYRREKLRYLNHNERTHQLQRQIRKAGSGSTRGRRDEELSAQSHWLALCTNLVMAYNTSCLQRTLDGLAQDIGSPNRYRDLKIYFPHGIRAHQLQRRDRLPVPALRGSATNPAPGRAHSKRRDLTGASVDRRPSNLLIYMLYHSVI
jgi:Tn3 transposase DDE domain